MPGVVVPRARRHAYGMSSTRDPATAQEIGLFATPSSLAMQISGKTQIYGIMGNPVAHSLSPAMHNRAFAALGLDKVYVAFAVTDVAKALAGFRVSGVRGLSVTIPHKQAVIPCLDSIDPVAQRIGAVNTLVFDEGRIHGLNTDWLGANRALAGAMELGQGRTVVLLGSGGSARAIGFGLQAAGADIVLASRTPEKGKLLAKNLACDWLPLANIAEIAADGLINATSAGMAPDDDISPAPREALDNFPVVMDIVYSPMETRLLREAKETGCKTIDGLAMLLYQGVSQFEHWTGLKAPVDVMRETLLEKLGG